jgi:Zn-dependent peptidase ImmA (M78 family)/DNA-binding XRE family transcriptional regulator
MSSIFDREVDLKQVIGRNLKEFRELAAFSQGDFADKLGFSRATLSAIENGHASIDSATLVVAARLLGRQVGDFFEEAPEKLQLMYRAATDVTAPLDVRARFERFCKAYRELEEIVGVQDNLLPPPEYSYSPDVQSKPLQFAAQVAASERDRLGLGRLDPIENIFRLMDERGLRIFHYPLPDLDVYGLSAFSRQYGACILLNSSNTLERQVFSLAHEYAHPLMHRTFFKSPEPVSTLEADHEMELMADTFAANFLVPESGLRESFRRDVGDKTATLEDVIFLKHHFRVSAEMMIRRLRDLDLVSKAQAESLQHELDMRKEPKQEIAPLSNDLIKEWQRTSRFEHLAKKAVLSESVSLGKLAELLGTSVVEAKKKSQEWRREMALA